MNPLDFVFKVDRAEEGRAVEERAVEGRARVTVGRIEGERSEGLVPVFSGIFNETIV